MHTHAHTHILYTCDCSLHVLDVLWIEEGEAHEFGLVEVHHEKLVGGSEFSALGGELFVKVAHVFSMSLERKGYKISFYLFIFLYILVCVCVCVCVFICVLNYGYVISNAVFLCILMCVKWWFCDLKYCFFYLCILSVCVYVCVN